jgi:hypothetical protein
VSRIGTSIESWLPHIIPKEDIVIQTIKHHRGGATFKTTKVSFRFDVDGSFYSNISSPQTWYRTNARVIRELACKLTTFINDSDHRIHSINEELAAGSGEIKWIDIESAKE